MIIGAFVAIAYLIGSVSFAVIVSRACGLPDPREYGSGNPGATNVLRTGNKLAAALTLLGDGVKGWIPVFAAQRLGAAFGIGDAAIALVAVAALVGHLYPAFFHFKGGKGVATAAGVLFGLDWRLGVFAVVTWAIVAALFRYSSLAALAAATLTPLFAVLVLGAHAYTGAVAVVAAMLVWRHRANIRKLLAGTEGRIGEKKSPLGSGG